jgi:preprotein translocase subunit SecG
MEALILVLHVLAAVIIIALVLLQQGKGADAGASFGGASQTVFGSQGGSSFFGKMTALFALVFFLTSFGLAYFASEQAKSVSGALDFVPSAPQVEETVGLPDLGGKKDTASDIPVTE